MKHISLGRGRPSVNVMNKHSFSAKIRPANCFSVLLPNEPQRGSEVPFCTDYWATFTNTKDLIFNSGQPKKTTYKAFITHYIEQKFSIYVLQVIAPTSMIEFKMNPQEKDSIYGNSFIHQHLI